MILTFSTLPHVGNLSKLTEKLSRQMLIPTFLVAYIQKVKYKYIDKTLFFFSLINVIKNINYLKIGK